MQMYYVITNSDGDTTVTEVDGETLKERLAEGYWGNVGFKRDLSGNTDTNYWGENILIIKGNIIVPQPVQTVTEYKL